MALVAGACLAVTVGLLVAATHHAPLTLKTARHPALLPQVLGGTRVINFYSAFLVNRSERPYSITLQVGPAPFAVHWRGPSEPLQLAAGEHRRIDFGIETDTGHLVTPRTIEVVMRDASGNLLAASPVTLTVPLAAKGVNQSR
jgi:hypothetical protein